MDGAQHSSMSIWGKARMRNSTLEWIFILVSILTFVGLARGLWMGSHVARVSNFKSTIASRIKELERTDPHFFDQRQITFTAPTAPVWTKTVTSPALSYWSTMAADAALVRTSEGQVIRLSQNHKIIVGPTSSLEFQSATAVPVSVSIIPMYAPSESKHPQP